MKRLLPLILMGVFATVQHLAAQGAGMGSAPSYSQPGHPVTTSHNPTQELETTKDKAGAPPHVSVTVAAEQNGSPATSFPTKTPHLYGSFTTTNTIKGEKVYAVWVNSATKRPLYKTDMVRYRTELPRHGLYQCAAHRLARRQVRTRYLSRQQDGRPRSVHDEGELRGRRQSCFCRGDGKPGRSFAGVERREYFSSPTVNRYVGTPLPIGPPVTLQGFDGRGPPLQFGAALSERLFMKLFPLTLIGVFATVQHLAAQGMGGGGYGAQSRAPSTSYNSSQNVASANTAATKSSGPAHVSVTVAAEEKGNPATTFPTKTTRLYGSFTTTGTDKGERVYAVWVNAATKKPLYKTDMVSASPNFNGNVSINAPPTGWPAGKYELDIYLGNKMAARTTFNIK